MSACSFRPAQETDRQAIVTLVQEMPGGGIADALWEAWLADDQCEVAVGEMDGEIVALGRVAVVGAREGWLGLQQIDPGHRQQGVTLGLTSYQADRAQKAELRVLRWGVSSANTGAQRVASKLGFHRVAVWGAFVAEHFGTGAPNLTTLDERHYSHVQNWLGRSAIFRTSGSLFEQVGSWQELTGKKMHALLAAGQVMGLTGEDGAVPAFAILSAGSSSCPGAVPADVCRVGYVDGEWMSLQSLALALRGHAARDSQEQVRVMLTGEPTVRGIFQAAGYREETDGRDLWIYERLLA